MKRIPVRVMMLGLVAGTCLPLAGLAATVRFTTNTTIDSTNSLYEGQALIVDGCQVTINGTHLFESLTISNAGVVTHSAATTVAEYALRLTLLDRLRITAGASLNVAGKGYLSGRTVGNTTTGAAGGVAGGSHGGLGAEDSLKRQPNDAYGDFRQPVRPGSGGGGADGLAGGSGGGAVRVAAPVMVVDGWVAADGALGSGGGGGSGGAIWLEAGTLSGSGRITADGQPGLYAMPAGGGGRVAVYYQQLAGFSLTNIHARAGTNVVNYFAAPGTVFLSPSAGLEELRVASGGRKAGMWTPLGQAGELGVGVQTLTISGTNTLLIPRDGQAVRTWNTTIGPGSRLAQPSNTTTRVYELRLVASNLLTIAAGGSLTAQGRGYRPGYTFDNTTNHGPAGASGGSHGGAGGAAISGGSVSPTYGDALFPVLPGGGGGTVLDGGSGGGSIRVDAGTLDLQGAINADGGVSTVSGGGAGGSVLINAGQVQGSGYITARGTNGSSALGGCGGGGRVAVYYRQGMALAGSHVTASGGGPLRPGGTGTVWLTTQPAARWRLPVPYLSGQATVGWDSAGFDPTGCAVRCQAFLQGAAYTVVDNAGYVAGVSWDTTQVPDGNYELRAVFQDPAHAATPLELYTNVLVNNAVTWHWGTITGQQTWATGTIHAIAADLTVAGGARLNIAPGCLVKVAPQVQIKVLPSGTLAVTGTASRAVWLTSLLDDDRGGDTNLDADRSQPGPGDWRGIWVEPAGVLLANAFTRQAYGVERVGGRLPSNTTWRGDTLYHVTADLYVTNGVTLALEAGAVVKVASNMTVVVTRGGRLVSAGTFGRPVVFTSDADDTRGGDTLGDGDWSVPSPGIWYGINLQGGQAWLDYTRVLYGGRFTLLNMNQAGVAALNGARAYISNSVISHALSDGVQCTYAGLALANCVLDDNDRGIAALNSATVSVVNCTIAGNRLGLAWNGSLATVTVFNAIITDNIEAGLARLAGLDWLTIRYACLWNASNTQNTAAWQPGTNGNLNAEPGLKDVSNGNYRLNFQSPCIDAANSLLAPPADSTGATRYTDPRTQPKGIPDAHGVYADLGAFEFVENAASDLDLVARNVDGPQALLAGTTVTVAWADANIGIGTVRGAWQDEVALVPDQPCRGVDRIVVADVAVSGTLGPNQSQACTARVRVPLGTEGTWRWQVRVNARGDIFEGINWRNNDSPLAGAASLQLQEIRLGTTITAAFASVTSPVGYVFRQAAGTSCVAVLNGATVNGACRLYAGYDSLPTVQNFDSRSRAWNQPDASLDLPAAGAQTVYLLAVPEALPDAALGFTLGVHAAAFALRSVDLAGAGNIGYATIPLNGEGFGHDLAVRLVQAGGTSNRAAHRIVVADAIRALATFDLRGLPAGAYHVAAQQGALTSVLSNAFTVAVGTGGRFRVSLAMPAQVRLGRVFEGTVEFVNEGDVDIPIPMLFLRSMDHNPIWLGPMEREDTRYVIQFPALPDEDYTAGMIRPGYHGRIPFYSVIRQPVFGASRYEVHWLPSTLTDIMDWDNLRAHVTPAASGLLWSNAWSLLVNEIGPTVGDYFAALAAAAEEARRLGLGLWKPEELMWFMMQQAMAEYPGAACQGRLYLNDLNQPLPGQAVVLAAANGDFYGQQSWYDGSFTFRDVPAGAYTLSVPGYQCLALTNVTIPATQQLAVVVAAGAGVAGRVTAEGSGDPVPFAMVILRDHYGTNTAHASTDAAGAYALGGLRLGTYDISCWAPGYVSVVDNLLVISNGTAAASFSLAAGGVISGRVVGPDGATGASGARVSAYASAGYNSTLAGTNGLFRLSGLPAATYRITAVASNYAYGQNTNVVLASGGLTTGVVLQLVLGGAVTGRVVAAGTGQPLTNAILGVDSPVWLEDQPCTGADGSFAVQAVHPGWQQVWCQAPGYVPGVVTTLVSAGIAANASLALRPAGRISGTVQLSDGTPLATAPVWLISTNLATLMSTTTTLAGAYGFAGLGDGAYVLAVGSAQGMAVGARTVNLGLAGNQATGQLLVVTGAVVAGTARMASGAVVANAKVSLGRGGQCWASTLTDATGQYRFLLLRTGLCQVAVLAPTVALAGRTNLVIPAVGVYSGIDITGSTRRLVFALRTAQSGVPLTNAVVELARRDFTADLGSLWAVANASGLAVFSNLAAGTSYEYTASVAGCIPWAGSLALTGLTTHVALSLTNGGTLKGQVTDAQGRPVAGALVTARAAGPGLAFTTSSGAAGAYALAGLPTGELSLWAVADGFAPAARTGLVMLAGVDQVQTITLVSNAVAWTGRLAGPGQVPLRLAMVHWQEGNGYALRTASADGEGGYALQNVPASGTLRVEADGLAIATFTYTSPADPILSNLQLSAFSALGLPPVAAGRQAGPRGDVWQDFTDWLWAIAPRPTRSPMESALNRQDYRWASPVNASCPAYQNAYHHAQATEQLMRSAFWGWEDSYEYIKDINFGYYFLMFSRGVKLSTEIIQLVLQLRGMTGSLVASRQYEQYAALLAGVENTVPNLVDLALSREFGEMPGYLIDLQDMLNALSSLAPEHLVDAKFAAAHGLVVSMISIVMHIYNLVKDYRAWEEECLRAFKDYFRAGKHYQEAVWAHWNATVAVYLAARQDCPECRDVCNPCQAAFGQPPPPPDPCCGQPQPCPDPCAGKPCGGQPPCVGCGGAPGGGSSGGGGGEQYPDPRMDGTPGPLHCYYGCDDDGPIPRGSFDPNDKQATGYGAAGHIAERTRIYYTIRFENQTNATAPAQEVVITDALSPQLDWSTFELGDIGFNNVVVPVPSGLYVFATNSIVVATDAPPVSVSAALDPATGIAQWRLQAVDPVTGGLPEDPLAGFLPPNDTNHVGEGFVAFSVQPASNLVEGTVVSNAASIVFDANAPIITPAAINTVDTTPPVSAVTALPEISPPVFNVQWQGADTGAGITMYEIYVQQNGKGYSLWIVTNATTSCQFIGAVGSRYDFYSVAVDGAGYREVIPRSGTNMVEAATRIVIGLPWLINLLE